MIRNIKSSLASVAQSSLLLVLCLVFVAINVGQTFALSREQKRVIDSGSHNFNVEEINCTPTNNFSNFVGGGSIYVLGDSLTVGMRDAGDLEAKLRNSGWAPTKINAVGGKMINWGIEQVGVDRDIISASDSILIGLGTNNVGTVVDGSTAIEGGAQALKGGMQVLVDDIKAINADIRIYWTNIHITGMLSTEYGTFDMDVAKPLINGAISELAVENGIAILPWATSTEAPQLVSSDGIHPSGKYPEMADYIVAQLSNNSAGSPAASGGCACKEGGAPLTGSDNQQKAFNFFVGKGYKPEWAAGIVGNMVHESGVQPMRLQGTPNGQETPSNTLGLNMTKGIGWGIVQWTPPAKMVTTSVNEGFDYSVVDTLEYQLEFVWKQLEGTSIASNEKGAGDHLKQQTTASDSGRSFMTKYERPADQSEEKQAARAATAQEIFDIYSGTAPAAGSGAGGCSNGGVAGKNGWDLPGEGEHPMVYYSQRKSGSDPAVQGYYGNDSYGPGPISHCGCGPTSWAMIVSTLTGQQVLPPDVAAWAHDNGWQQSGDPCGGSQWWWGDNNKSSEERWGVVATKIETTDDAAAAIRSGALIMVSSNATNTGNESPFTSGGHLLVMRAVTDDGKFLFADPNDYNDTRAIAQAAFHGGSKSRTPLAPEQFMPSTQGMWAVTKL